MHIPIVTYQLGGTRKAVGEIRLDTDGNITGIVTDKDVMEKPAESMTLIIDRATRPPEDTVE